MSKSTQARELYDALRALEKRAMAVTRKRNGRPCSRREVARAADGRDSSLDRRIGEWLHNNWNAAKTPDPASSEQLIAVVRVWSTLADEACDEGRWRTLLDDAQPQRSRPARGKEPAAHSAALTERDDAGPLAVSLHALAQAVRNQWHAEIRARDLYRPAPLPVPLAVTSGPLSGRTGTVTTCAELLGASPGERLVVTGPRGSGKTTCAMLLVEALLKDPRPGTPVPILLSLSSWDPEAEELRSWVARRITEDYPGALTGNVTARQLAEGRHLLPVLDGLEEIAESKRSLALRRIGQAYDSRDPLVLTCLHSEFKAAVDDGASLTSASVVSLLPVPLKDATQYLRPEDGDSPWDTVLPALAKRPGMARVVGSPLLVALLRTHFELPGRNPEELLAESEFPDATAVEEKLLDELVLAAFAPRPVGIRRPRQPHHAWPQPLAERWLNQLARRTDGGQLKWWQLSESVLASPLCQGLLGAVAGALWFVAAAAAAWPVREHFSRPLLFLAVATACVAVLFTQSFSESPAPPSQMWRGIERIPGRLRRARRLVTVFGKHVTIALSATGALIALCWILMQIGNGQVPTAEECRRLAQARGRDTCPLVFVNLGGPPGGGGGSTSTVEVKPEDVSNYILNWREFADKLPLLTGAVLIAAFVVFIYGLLASAPASDAFPTPRSSLAAARRRALGTTMLQAVGLTVAGTVLYSFVTLPYFRLPPGSLGIGILVIVTAVLWILSRSPWGRYVVAHCGLALRGKVPWRFMAFLEDAHRLNVLRQAGSAYEFRHGTLQEHLAHKPSVPEPKDGRLPHAETTTKPEPPPSTQSED